MKTFLKIIQRTFSRFAHFMMRLWTTLILTFLYFTLFAVIALFRKLFWWRASLFSKKKSMWQPASHMGSAEDWYHPF